MGGRKWHNEKDEVNVCYFKSTIHFTATYWEITIPRHLTKYHRAEIPVEKENRHQMYSVSGGDES